MLSEDLKFRKSERLCSKKTINELFEEAPGVFKIVHYPFILLWKMRTEVSAFPAQMAVAVSRKAARGAVSRNRIRRQIKEIYRLKKSCLYDYLQQMDMNVALLLIYTGKEKRDFNHLCQNFDALLEKFYKANS